MPHLYLSWQTSASAMEKERRQMLEWCRKNGAGECGEITENLTLGRISERQVERLLSGVRPGDLVVSPSLTRLGRSINMLIKVLKVLQRRGASLVTVNDGRHLSPSELAATIESLELAADLATAIRTERSGEAADLAYQRGHAAGRPRGSLKKPEKNVLYGKTTLIDSLTAQGIRPAEIARHLGVSRTTIYNYLKKKPD